MATRNERRRRARQRARAVDSQGVAKAGHDDHQMVARIVKAAESRQPQTQTSNEWDPDKTVPPPIAPDALWTIFEQNAIHSGCINAKVADSVGRGWKLTPKDDTEDGAERDVDRLRRELEDLLDAICPKLTFEQLSRQAVTEMDAIGWGAWEVLRDTAGDVDAEITGLLPVPPQAIRAIKDNDDLFCVMRGEKKVYFKRFGAEEQIHFRTGEPISDGDEAGDAANEIILFQHYSPRSSYYGIPPWVSGIPACAEFAAIREFNVSFFESGGQADRHIHVQSEDDDVAAQLADEIVKQLEDARGNAHVSLVTSSDNNTDVAVNSLTPKQPPNGRDGEFRGSKEDLKEEIRIAHQVPPGRLGIAAGGALAGNANDSMDDDYRYGVVKPLKDIVEAQLRRTLFGDKGFGEAIAGYTFEFEDRTQDDTDAEHNRAMEQVEKGVASPNDAREATGKDRVDDPALDRYYINGQPISSDPEALTAEEVLAHLKDALAAALAPTRSPEDKEIDDAAVDDTQTADQDAVYASENQPSRLRRAGWAVFRRKTDA